MTIKDNIPEAYDMDHSSHDTERLLQYLSGKLSEADRIAFEKQLEQDPMLKDAMEGFAGSELKEPAIRELDIAVNAALWKQVRMRKKRTKHRKDKAAFPLWIYVCAVLLIVVLCFLVFFMLK